MTKEQSVILDSDIEKFAVCSNGAVDVQKSIEKFTNYINSYKKLYDGINDSIKEKVISLLATQKAALKTEDVVSLVAAYMANNDLSKLNSYKFYIKQWIADNSSAEFDPNNPKLLKSAMGRYGGLSLFINTKNATTEAKSFFEKETVKQEEVKPQESSNEDNVDENDLLAGLCLDI